MSALAQVFVRQTHDDAREHGRVCVDGRLDFGGINVGTAGNDQVRAPVREIQIAVRVDAAEIAEGFPFALRARLGAEVVVCRATPAGRKEINLADFTRRNGLARVVEYRGSARPASRRPTEPLCSSHSRPPIIVAAMASVPEYTSQILSGPSHSIHFSLSQTGQAAAMWQTNSSEDRSKLSRSASGMRQMRCIMVGTWYSQLPRCRSICRSVSAGSNLGVITTWQPQHSA